VSLLYQARIFFKIVITSVPRALRASVRSTELSKNGKCGRNVKYKHGLSFAKQFSGGRIRKTETNVFEIWSRPRGGRSTMRNPRGLRHFFFWQSEQLRKNTLKIKNYYWKHKSTVRCFCVKPTFCFLRTHSVFISFLFSSWTVIQNQLCTHISSDINIWSIQDIV